MARYCRSFYAVLALALSFGLLVSCTRSSEEGLNPGDQAPNFEALGLNGGSKLSLSEFRGKVVLLNFWASWCGPCVAEMPALERLYTKLRERGFVVYAVGIDDENDELVQFRQRFGLSFPIALDLSGDGKRLYRTTGVPESFVIDRRGRIALFPDPEDGSPTTRITGPRQWDSPDVVTRFDALLR